MFNVYRKLIRLLRKECPPAFPVYVRRVKMSESKDGDCAKTDSAFYININKCLSEAAAIDTLLHEWAHARAWNYIHDSLNATGFEKVAHDPSWGVAYSEVYRIYEQRLKTD